MTTAIEIGSITKRYAKFMLQDVTLPVPVGTILGLIGRNGAGKTTLFHCILNLVRRDSGTIHMPGVTEDLSSDSIRRFVGYVPEQIRFYEWMTVKAALQFVSGFYDTWDEERCRDLMRRYALDSDMQIRRLSLGMRRRLGLIQALAIRPRLLILDEPTSGLDPAMKFQFLEDLRRIVDAGETQAILLSSHNLDEVERLVDRIAILKLGAVQCHESRSDLLESWHKLEFAPPDGMTAMASLGLTQHPLGPGRAMVVTQEDIGFVRERLARAGAAAITVARASLQEVFMQLA